MKAKNKKLPHNISIGDRWSIIGATGTGKTKFSIRLLEEIYKGTRAVVPIYVLESKRPKLGEASDFEPWVTASMAWTTDGDRPPVPFQPGVKPMWGKRKPAINIWRYYDDDHDLHEQWLANIFDAGVPAVIYVDELFSITTDRGKAPRSYEKILRQGRGQDIGLISATQSPSYIPAQLVRQASHVVRFRLNSDTDSEKLESMLGQRHMAEPAHAHGFYFRSVDQPIQTSPLRYYPDLSYFF